MKQRQQAKEMVALKQANLRAILTDSFTPATLTNEAEAKEEEEDEADDDSEGSDGPKPLDGGSDDDQVYDLAYELP
jgi:hypothetical protein